MPKLYIHTAKATGRGQFPIDMLRYDRCYPESESDSAQIQYDRSERSVTVVALTYSKFVGAAWTPKRWESFMWRLSDETVRPAAL